MAYSDNRWNEVKAGRVYPKPNTRHTRPEYTVEPTLSYCNTRHTPASDNRWHLAKVGRVYPKPQALKLGGGFDQSKAGVDGRRPLFD